MDVWEKAYQDWRNGMKYQAIADKHGLTLSAVKSKATRDWKNRDNKKVATMSKKSCNLSNKKLQPKAAKVATKKREQREPEIVEFEENPEDGLTDKQRLFCQYYVRTFNATQSYLKVYGCSWSTANTRGPALLGNARIRNEITRLKKIKNAALMVDGNDIIELMIRMAFADMNNFVEYGNKKTLMVRGGKIIKAKDLDPNAKKPEAPIEDFENFVKLCDSGAADGQLIVSVTEGRDGVSIKRADPLKVIFWLTEYFNLNPMSEHKKKFDEYRTELELLRIEATQPPPVNEQGGSNFIEALNATAEDIWDEDEKKESSDEQYSDKRDSETSD